MSHEKVSLIAKVFNALYHDNEIDDLELTVVRYKPDSLDSLCRSTAFTRKEIQLMYRGFKQGCPNGIVSLQQFKEIYAQFFPEGEGSKYALYVFNTFDQDSNGQISFDEFVMGLSVLSRGSMHSKLRWIFKLYDVSKRDAITEEDLQAVISSVYHLMGKRADPPVDAFAIREHVVDIFGRMDADKNGVVTCAEFIEACEKDEIVCKSLTLFDTVF